MSPYTFGGLLIGFVAYSGFLFYGGTKYESYKAGEADAKHDLAQQAVTVAAQEHVIATVQKQSTITQGADDAYAKSMSFISNQYAIPPVSLPIAPVATSNSLRPIPKPSSGISTSKVFHLTFQQCDGEESKLNAMWNWANQQAAIK